MKWERPFLNKRYNLQDDREVIEMDLATLWITAKTWEVGEVMLVVVEETATMVELVAAEVVKEVVMVDIKDLEVTEATMVVVLVIVVEEAMVAVD